ncbi:MAG: hypothetical protein BGP06_16220 [Rhizobiales bacterium 65-9]|nr:hypothetical protein [Hyphomicrobiales bacterium]OJY38011.1 MAG: hypothetical protein BGP06_16220 [Rhizobiales bacterium 65-9]
MVSFLSDGGDDRLIDPAARAAEIERLRTALEDSIAFHERMLGPPTAKEIARRALDRMWAGTGAYMLFVLVLVAFLVAIIWAPYGFPLPLTPLVVLAPAFFAAFARERRFGLQSSRAWRDAQADEAAKRIESLRMRLFWMGAEDGPDSGGGRSGAMEP